MPLRGRVRVAAELDALLGVEALGRPEQRDAPPGGSPSLCLAVGAPPQAQIGISKTLKNTTRGTQDTLKHPKTPLEVFDPPMHKYAPK